MVLTDIDEVDSLSRNEIMSVVTETYSRVAHTVSLPLHHGGDFKWDVCRPDLLLRYFVEKCDIFNKVVQNTVRRTGQGVPLNIVLYCDEITPGNILRPENKRRFDAFYFSFREFGAELLCRAEMWLPLAILRSGVIRTVRGGLSNCVRLLLRTFFVEGTFASTGVPLATEEPVLLFGRLGNLLADEAALKACWNSKGASGLKPCFVCKNVVMRNSDLIQGQHYLVETTCSDFNRFDISSDDDVWAAYDNLRRQHGTGTKARFEQLEMACGFGFDPDAMLGDMELRRHVLPASCTTYDWLHVYIASGIVNVELAVFFRRARESLGIKFEHVVQFAQASWTWPRVFRRHGKVVQDMFSETREKACKDTMKCGASEILGAYPLLRFFVQTIIAPTRKLDMEVKSLLSLFRCLDLLVRAKQKVPRPDALLAAIQAHSKDYQAAYKEDTDLKPKHHFAFHVPSQLARDGVLLDTFTVERKHQLAKHHAGLHRNTTAFERVVISRVVLSQTRDLQNLVIGNELLGKTTEYPPLADALGVDVCLVADALQLMGGTYTVKDVIFAESSTIWVQACAKLDGSLCLMVACCSTRRWCSRQAQNGECCPTSSPSC